MEQVARKEEEGGSLRDDMSIYIFDQVGFVMSRRNKSTA